jgi:hypothetical protein
MRTMGTAQQLHLARAARIAGEAFAFDEPETARAPSRATWLNALWLAIALMAVTALWFTF